MCSAWAIVLLLLVSLCGVPPASAQGTVTITETHTPTESPTGTPSATPTSTATTTFTPSPTPTSTSTASPTSSPSPTPTSTGSASPTPTTTATNTITSTRSQTLTVIPTKTATGTRTSSPTPTKANPLATARAPVFNPDGDKIADGALITITSPTTGSNLCFTTDGKDPVCSDDKTNCAYGFLYNGPITKTLQMDFQSWHAVACRPGMFSSPVTTMSKPIVNTIEPGYSVAYALSRVAGTPGPFNATDLARSAAQAAGEPVNRVIVDRVVDDSAVFHFRGYTKVQERSIASRIINNCNSVLEAQLRINCRTLSVTDIIGNITIYNVTTPDLGLGIGNGILPVSAAQGGNGASGVLVLVCMAVWALLAVQMAMH